MGPRGHQPGVYKNPGMFSEMNEKVQANPDEDFDAASTASNRRFSICSSNGKQSII